MKIYFIFFLLMIISAIGTFAYGARLAGVRTKNVSSASALYNILTLFSRLANMLLLPSIGSVVEASIKSGNLPKLTDDFHFMFLGMTLGTLLSILFIPTMSDLFVSIIKKLEIHRSIPKLIIAETNFKNLVKVLKKLRFTDWSTIKNLKPTNIPKGVLILNPIIHAIYSVGFLSALYAGALSPEYRLVTSQLSSSINGFATIALFVFVDPVLSVISDDVVKNKRPLIELKATIAWLAFGRFVGTLLAQILFVPVAYFIVWVSNFFI